MPRFVILEHDSPRGRHWDFMLQAGESLATWALSEPPDADATVIAESLADHRLAYLDYQGPISGGRGSVTRWDEGTYTVEQQSATQWVVMLDGQKLRGKVTLVQDPNIPSRWRFTYSACSG